MLQQLLTKEQIDQFDENGFLEIKAILTQTEVEYYRNLYEDFLAGKVDVAGYRSDLGGHASDAKIETKAELITQIMVPSLIVPSLHNEPLHKKSPFNCAATSG